MTGCQLIRAWSQLEQQGRHRRQRPDLDTPPFDGRSTQRSKALRATDSLLSLRPHSVKASHLGQEDTLCHSERSIPKSCEKVWGQRVRGSVCHLPSPIFCFSKLFIIEEVQRQYTEYPVLAFCYMYFVSCFNSLFFP